MTIHGIDHVQLAMPEGGEAAARLFYGEVLGLAEVPKPAALAGRGGVWFEGGAARLHLGVEAGFRPAQRAHPALLVDDLPELVARCEAAGFPVTCGEDLGPYVQTYVADPFGNRLELIARARP